MKGFKEAYKSIFHYYNEHGSHENSFYILNMHWIYFIPNQSFMNILHGYKLVHLPYVLNFCYLSCETTRAFPDYQSIVTDYRMSFLLLNTRSRKSKK